MCDTRCAKRRAPSHARVPTSPVQFSIQHVYGEAGGGGEGACVAGAGRRCCRCCECYCLPGDGCGFICSPQHILRLYLSSMKVQLRLYEGSMKGMRFHVFSATCALHNTKSPTNHKTKELPLSWGRRGRSFLTQWRGRNFAAANDL